MLGQFTDDQNMSILRTLVCQIRPVEVIVGSELRNSSVIKMLKNSPIVPIFNYLTPDKCYGFTKTCVELEKYFGENLEEWPKVLGNFKRDEKWIGFEAVGMTIAFLTDALIDQETLKTGMYSEYNP